MCELLGVSVWPDAHLGVYFHEFRPRAEENREGWGIAWWEGNRFHLVKEPLPAHESERAELFGNEAPDSNVFIVHVRAATVGEPTYENTHPFTGSALGREWAFAHNGTVQELDRLDAGGYTQGGDTDSELAFHHMLNRLERVAAARGPEAIAAEVLATGRELSERNSLVNFLLSDGETLFAYHDGHRTLHVIEKRADDLGEIGMADADYDVALRLTDAPDERVVIVASVPLTSEPGWRKLDAGEFLVIRDGLVMERVEPGGALASSRKAS